MLPWKILLSGFFVHLIFFYSIFDIYFTSPLVHGMTSQSNPLPPAADRLVLFVADGLRADKFYETINGKAAATYLRRVIQYEGAWGISHTHVPTESRPGHVAIIAGFYEDVSAVAKGWKENPVEFDSLFNRSTHTFSWGSPDILPMFAKGASGSHVYTHTYPAESEDFAGSDLTELDKWVFRSVQDVMIQARTDDLLKAMLTSQRVVFFLHLLGLDTTGHAKKPQSKEYLANIGVVDEIVMDTVKLMEQFYNHDGRTSYVFTSDHGMTDWGSHGAGTDAETRTPLLAWGAGIRKPRPANESDTLSTAWGLGHLHREDVEQADLCPLMACLLGVAFPVNSVGQLPVGYLADDLGGTAHCLATNAKQLVQQLEVKERQKRKNTFALLFRPYRSDVSELLLTLESSLKLQQYDKVTQVTGSIMTKALEGLKYYHQYDRLFLGSCVVLGFLAWMLYILLVILQGRSVLHLPPHPAGTRPATPSFLSSPKGVRLGCVAVVAVTTLLLYVQSAPLTHYLYPILAQVLWYKVIQRRAVMRRVWWYIQDYGYLWSLIGWGGVCLLAIQILVVSFFRREVLSLGLVGLAVWPMMTVSQGQLRVSLGWFLSTLSLAVFPFLPTVGGEPRYELVLLSGSVILSAVLLLMLMAYCFPQRVPVSYHLLSSKITIVQLLLLALSLFIVHSVSSCMAASLPIPPYLHVLSWLILASSLVLPTLTPTLLHPRLLSVALSLSGPYLLLSSSHEGLFMLALCTQLYFWVQLEQKPEVPGRAVGRGLVDLHLLDFANGPGLLTSSGKITGAHIRTAYVYVYMLVVAFFGTGNIASINSFTLSSVYCFLSVFNPFVMGALLMWKNLMPYVLVCCTFHAIHLVGHIPTQSLLLIVLLISDLMALHFFFLVKDHGSWLDIGTSISHYVIVMSLICFLILILVLSTYFVKHRWTRPRHKRQQEEDKIE